MNVAEEDNYESDRHTEEGFELGCCTEDEVLKVINNIPANKADGIDGIPIKAIKLGIPLILKPLTDLINLFIKNGFPKELKRAIVLPIHKKGSMSLPDNYRPISLLPCVSKIAERVIVNQLNSHLASRNLMSNCQHGFRQKHSTGTGLLQITEYTRGELDKGKAVGIVALDLSKAFDSIDHQILLRKLPDFQLGSNFISLMRNYLKDRTIVVRCGEEVSKIFRTTTGVPQGSILGPLLFTLYVNDPPDVIKHSKAMLYADDTTIFTSSRYPSNIQAGINEDIRSMERWFRDNKLSVNAKKTEYMLVTNTRLRHRFNGIKIQVNKQLIIEKEHIKILGVTISNDLSWEQHTLSLVGELRHRYRSFNRSCNLLTHDAKMLLYNACIASRLNYCDFIWHKCHQASASKLQTIQNRCARRILGSSPESSALPLIRELGWLTLAEKRNLHKCVMLHELLLGRGPQILIEGVRPWTNTHTRTTRATSDENLAVIAHNTDYMAKSFYYDTAKIWNNIPSHIRRISNRNTFKENLYRHFLGPNKVKTAFPGHSSHRFGRVLGSQWSWKTTTHSTAE